MIIESLLTLITRLLQLLFAPIQLLSLPLQIATVIETATVAILDGLAVLASYTHLSYLLVLLGIVVAVDAAFWVYHLFMWILKKIPFINIH